MSDYLSKLGSPDIHLAGLHIWMHGRAFQEAQDFWDGNMIRVSVHCGGNGASVVVMDAFVHLPELEKWHDALKKRLVATEGEANLECLEPNLAVKLTVSSFGHVRMEVSITPDHMTQRHWFEFEIDQTFLPPVVKQLGDVLREYPVRDPPK